DTTRSVFTDLDPGDREGPPGEARKKRSGPLLLLGVVGLLVLLGVGVMAYPFLGRGSRAKEEPAPETVGKPEAREARLVLKEHRGPVLALAFCPAAVPPGSRGQGTRVVLLASCSQDGTIKLWNPVNGRPVATPARGGAGPVPSLAFSADGKNLAWAEGRTVHVWDLATAAEWEQFDTQHP